MCALLYEERMSPVSAPPVAAGGIAVLLQGCCSSKPRAHAAFEVLCKLTDPQVLPAKQVKNTLKDIQVKGLDIVPQLLCPEIIPSTPGQDDLLVEMGEQLRIQVCIMLMHRMHCISRLAGWPSSAVHPLLMS